MKKVIAHDVISIRTARGGDYAPLIAPVPKKIAEVMHIKNGDMFSIFTDGERLYLERFTEPTI
jgi:hypothetical protein